MRGAFFNRNESRAKPIASPSFAPSTAASATRGRTVLLAAKELGPWPASVRRAARMLAFRTSEHLIHSEIGRIRRHVATAQCPDEPHVRTHVLAPAGVHEADVVAPMDRPAVDSPKRLIAFHPAPHFAVPATKRDRLRCHRRPESRGKLPKE